MIASQLVSSTEQQHAAINESVRHFASKLVSERGVRLHPHQIEGVVWMMEREKREDMVSCGILADDMGMGKTMTASALLYCNPYDTLIVTTLATLMQWRHTVVEVTGCTPNLLIRGNVCEMPPADPEGRRIAITTYSAIESYCRANASRSKDNKSSSGNYDHTKCMVARHWGRVILDEGHVIRNRKTSTFKAVMRLRGDRRWVLSGTPINNRRQDLCALGEWMGVPILEGDATSQYILRRTPSVMAASFEDIQGGKSVSASVRQAQLQTHIVRIPFKDNKEAELYGHLAKAYREKAGQVAESGSKNNAAMEILLRMRQCCVHPALCIRGMQKKRLYNPLSIEDSDIALLRDYGSVFSVGASIPVLSTKFNHVVNSVSEFCDQPGSGKVLIFCEWIQEMTMLKTVLETTAAVQCCEYHGGLSVMERENNLTAFSQQDDLRVMLVQIRCGGTGLNLQMASRVIITSPNWNPCSDLQALCRSYRQGQTKDVVCERLVISGTVEEKCMDMQMRKVAHSRKLFTDQSFSTRLGFAQDKDSNS